MVRLRFHSAEALVDHPDSDRPGAHHYVRGITAYPEPVHVQDVGAGGTTKSSGFLREVSGGRGDQPAIGDDAGADPQPYPPAANHGTFWSIQERYWQGLDGGVARPHEEV